MVFLENTEVRSIGLGLCSLVISMQKPGRIVIVAFKVDDIFTFPNVLTPGKANNYSSVVSSMHNWYETIGKIMKEEDDLEKRN